LIKYLTGKFNLPLNIIGYAASGDEALTMIHSLRPDIVFLDIEMPKYNGLEVMEKLRSSYRGTIKFIVITAYGYFEYAQAALRLGAKDILLKPIDPKQFLETMERVMGNRYTDNSSFNEILEYVNNNFDKPMGLEECAKQFYISPNYLSRMFKKYTGASFITYINELRIKKAVELLKDTDMSIKETAQKVGYNNLNYFYKTFKAVTGITPKTFKGNS
jgi:two-component system response regulator YesN